MVLFKGFRPGRKCEGGDDEWCPRARLLKDCGKLVKDFEWACCFDPMVPPTQSHEMAGEGQGHCHEVVAEQGASGECGEMSGCGGEAHEILQVDDDMVTWDTLARAGVGVNPADKERTPPQFRWVSHNYWRTPQPQVNRAKLPRKYAERTGTAGRQCRVIERLGQGTICQENCQDLIECDPSCPHNSHVSNR